MFRRLLIGDWIALILCAFFWLFFPKVFLPVLRPVMLLWLSIVLILASMAYVMMFVCRTSIKHPKRT